MTPSLDQLHRRALLGGGLMLAAAPVASARSPQPPGERFWPAQTRWEAPPPQAPAREGFVEVDGVRLWYWDTGGGGEPIVLLHPATGSGAIWLYQQPVFVAAGYRVIAYSRRGHYRSDAGPRDRTGSVSADLHALVEKLGLDRLHLVGSAFGALGVSDYVLSHPKRVASLVIASSRGGLEDPDYAKLGASLTPPTFNQAPPDFRELGPSYRAGSPDGAARWLALEHQSLTGERVTQGLTNTISSATLGTIDAPALVLTGDSDLYQPPSMARLFAANLRNASLAVIGECGHSAYWEQPLAFNRAVLDFIGRASKPGRRRSRA